MRIFLTGFMGCGKTTVGRELAKQLGWDFFDTDWEVERNGNCKIPEIFEKKGEDYFRKLENQAIRDCLAKDPIVVALGGGALLDEQNQTLVKESGRLAYLEASIDWVFPRLRKSRYRPLIPKNPPVDDHQFKHYLQEMLTRRVTHYQSSDLTVRVDHKNTKEIVSELRRLLNL